MNISRSFFSQSVGVLAIGTVIAQGIGYLVAPLISRLYSPDDMGELGLYMRVVGLGSVIITARYELSIPIAKSDYHGVLLTRLATWIVALFFILFTIASFIWLIFFTDDFITESLWLLLVGISIVTLALTNVGVNLATRLSKFSQISSSRIYQSLGTHFFRLCFGLLNFGSIGLLLGSTLGFIFGLIGFNGSFRSVLLSKSYPQSNRKTYLLASQYRDFPFISLPHAVMELAKDVIVALVIIYFFSQELFGSFSYAFTMLRLPLLVIGAAIGQVFFKKLADLNHHKDSLYPTVKKLLIQLFSLSFIPFLILQFFGEETFGFVFGAEWKVAGSMAEIMSIWLFFNFISSPISTLPIILNKQRPFFLLGSIMTLSQLIGFGIVPLFIGKSTDDFMSILIGITISQAILQVVYIWMSIHYVRSTVASE